MAENTRDVSLKLGVTTEGAEKIRALADEMRDLAKQGSDAAPEFERLGAEFDKIATQQAAVQAFTELAAQVDKTAAAFNDAQDNVKKLGAALDQQKTTTDQFRQQQTAAASSIFDIKKEIVDLESKLRTYRAESDATVRSTQAYREEVTKQRNAIADKRNELAKAQLAESQLADTVSKSEKALKAATKEYDNAGKSAESLAASLRKQSAALDESQQQVAATGLAAKELSAAQAEVQASFTKTQTAAQKQADAFAEAKRGAEQLAKAQKILDAELQLQREIAEDAIKTTERERAAAEALIKTRREQAAAERAAAEASAAAVRQQAAAAQQALDDAFAKTGARSARQIQAEIAEINAALVKLSLNADISGKEFDRAFAGGQQKIAALTKELQTIPGHLSASERAAGLLRSQFGQLAAAYGAIEIGQKFLDANIQIETLRRSLTLITGSTQGAAAQIQFLQNTANRAGIAVGSISQAFVNFAASAKATNIPLETMQGVFEGLTIAAGTLGLSSDKVALQLQAVSQIANKGKVSLEELQGQLGESLPGALSITAKGLGITEQELVKLVESGRLLARDFFPAFREGLKTFDTGAQKVEGLSASISRLKNQFTELAQSLGDSGIGDALKGTLQGFGVAVGTIGVGLNTVFESVFTLVRQISVGIAALVTGDLKNFGAEAERLAEESFKRQAKVVDSYRQMIGALDGASSAQTTLAESTQTAATAQQQLSASSAAVVTSQQQLSASSAAVVTSQQQVATAVTTTASQMGTAAQQTQVLTAVNVSAGREAVRTAIAMGQTGAAILEAGKAASGALPGWVQLVAEFEKAVPIIKAQVDEKKKLVESTKLAGDASIQMAQLSGNEVTALDAATVAARDNAAAVAALKAARTDEVATLIQQRDALLEYIRVTGDGGEARAAEIEAIQQKINAARAELEVTHQQTEAARQEAAERALAAATYKDNANNIDLYREAVEKAKIKLEEMRKAFAEGKVGADELREAERQLAATQGLLKDAYEDATKAIARRRQALQEDSNLASKRTDLARREYEVSLKVAEATSQASDKYTQQINLKNLDIRATQDKITAAQKEAGLLREEAALLQKKLDLNDPLYAQKKREIDSILNAAKAKELEGQIEQANLKELNTELQILDGTLKSSGQSLMGFGSSARSAAKDLDVFSEAARKARNESKTLSTLGSNTYDSQGFATDSNGQRINITGQLNIPPGYYFDKQAYDRAVLSAVRAHQRMPDPQNFVFPIPGNAPTGPTGSSNGSGSGGNYGAAGWSPFGTSSGGYNPNVYMMSGSGASSSRSSGTPSTVTPSSSTNNAGTNSIVEPKGSASPYGATTVNINLNGQQETMQVVGRSDTVTLERVLRSLWSGQRASGLSTEG